MDLDKYKEIRPLVGEEVTDAITTLLSNEELRTIYTQLGASPQWEEIGKVLQDCPSHEEFKRRFSYHLVKYVMTKTCQSAALGDTTHLSPEMAYTYISNHRDIILDSAFLNVLVYDQGLRFPQIAIGDNLMVRPWVTTLVKLNGSFLVRRNLQGREVLLAARELSEYMHDAIAQGSSLWIAQREGRAKDSTDHTQPALLKMLSIGGKDKDIREALRPLNIVPTTCSYEYDPCDFLKAREMQLKRDLGEAYRKTKAEDALNMKTGVLGYKGRVQFAVGRPLNELMTSVRWSDDPVDYVTQIASLMDDEIHRHYTLYPINYLALAEIDPSFILPSYITQEDRSTYEGYVSQRLSLIQMPQGITPDFDYLRTRILEMYANPLRNYLRVHS